MERMKDLEKKVEKAARKHSNLYKESMIPVHDVAYYSFYKGLESSEAREYWQQGMYTEEEVLNMLNLALGRSYDVRRIRQWFDANKKK